jgi:hypothetical protein
MNNNSIGRDFNAGSALGGHEAARGGVNVAECLRFEKSVWTGFQDEEVAGAEREVAEGEVVKGYLCSRTSKAQLIALQMRAGR